MMLIGRLNVVSSLSEPQYHVVDPFFSLRKKSYFSPSVVELVKLNLYFQGTQSPSTHAPSFLNLLEMYVSTLNELMKLFSNSVELRSLE